MQISDRMTWPARELSQVCMSACPAHPSRAPSPPNLESESFVSAGCVKPSQTSRVWLLSTSHSQGVVKKKFDFLLLCEDLGIATDQHRIWTTLTISPLTLLRLRHQERLIGGRRTLQTRMPGRHLPPTLLFRTRLSFGR